MKNPILSICKAALPFAAGAIAYAAMKLREQNSPVKEQPHSDAPIIAALGDSITFGAGVAATRTTDTWEKKLESMFNGKYQVLNYGISGATLLNTGNKPYWNMPENRLKGFPEAALALKPKIMLLMLGTNDSKPYNWNRGQYAHELDMRVKEILNSGCVEELILMCPPFTCPAEGAEKVGFDIQNEIIRDEIQPIVKTCAIENHIRCIDLYSLTNYHKEYFADGVHPNSFGNYIIAKHIFDFLTEENNH